MLFGSGLLLLGVFLVFVGRWPPHRSYEDLCGYYESRNNGRQPSKSQMDNYFFYMLYSNGSRIAIIGGVIFIISLRFVD